MPGLPKQFAKFGFKKGWKMYRAKMHGEILGGKKRGKKRRSHYIGADMSIPTLIQRPVSNFSKITPQKIFSPVVDLLLLIVGMSVGAGIKKAIPIKNPHLMNGVQTVGGIGASLVTKNRFIKMPLIGMALQSAISEVKLLNPKMLPIAGDDEVLYLPAGEDDDTPQLVYMGEDGQYYEVQGEADDGRVGAVYDGEEIVIPTEIIDGDDERVGAVYDGEEDEFGGEGSND